jgi:hypothetical protein
MKFVSDLRQVGRFSPGTPVSDKTYHHNIAEILLKVALNTKKNVPLPSPRASGFY